MLVDAHDPSHQTRLPRMILGLCALVPVASLAILPFMEGAARAGMGYFSLLWTGLLVLVFGGWMVKTQGVPLDRKVAWGFAFVLLAPITLPLYWYRHVWNAPVARVRHA